MRGGELKLGIIFADLAAVLSAAKNACSQVNALFAKLGHLFSFHDRSLPSPVFKVAVYQTAQAAVPVQIFPAIFKGLVYSVAGYFHHVRHRPLHIFNYFCNVYIHDK